MGASRSLSSIALAALLALPVFGAARAAAGAEQAEGQKFKDWTVKCEDATAEHGRRCVLVQGLSRKDGDKVRQLMSTVVGRFGDQVGFAILFTVPLGVFLPAGMVLQVDGADDKTKLEYQFCTRHGCRAALKLDDRWLGRLKAGSKATVTIEDARRKAVPLPVSLHGFTAGLGHIPAE